MIPTRKRPNIRSDGTFAGAWVYLNQRNGWQLVQFGKFGSWLLLMIISFVLISFVHSPRLPPPEGLTEETPIQNNQALVYADERNDA